MTLKFDGWPWKTIGHLFYATSSFVQFHAIGEFKLSAGNAQSGFVLARATLKFDGTYSPKSSFISSCEFKLELQSGNVMAFAQAQNGVNFDFEGSIWPWRSRPIIPQNNRALNQGLLHLWSKFGDPSLNSWWVIAQANSWLTDTQTHTHIHTHAGNDNTRGQNWPRVKTSYLNRKRRQAMGDNEVMPMLSQPFIYPVNMPQRTLTGSIGPVLAQLKHIYREKYNKMQ